MPQPAHQGTALGYWTLGGLGRVGGRQKMKEDRKGRGAKKEGSEKKRDGDRGEKKKKWERGGWGQNKEGRGRCLYSRAYTLLPHSHSLPLHTLSLTFSPSPVLVGTLQWLPSSPPPQPHSHPPHTSLGVELHDHSISLHSAAYHTYNTKCKDTALYMV